MNTATFTHFRLIGCTLLFKVSDFYTVLGSVACVEGTASVRGRAYRTRARVADVIPEVQS